MKNFVRALRFAWPYKFRVAASVVCALLAALFWSLNFTAIYPILKIISSDQNLQEWINSSIVHIQTKQIEPLEKTIEVLHAKRLEYEQWPAGMRDEKLRQNTLELAKTTEKLEASHRELYYNRLIKKYV